MEMPIFPPFTNGFLSNKYVRGQFIHKYSFISMHCYVSHYSFNVLCVDSVGLNVCTYTFLFICVYMSNISCLLCWMRCKWAQYKGFYSFCLYNSSSITSSSLAGWFWMEAGLVTSISRCVKSGVTTMASTARLVLVGDRISWHTASETVSHSAPCLLTHCSCQLA